ncbi:MAG: hypothetical protein HWE22_02235 [Flavobacteriales bacterium]|nr:hypothetical protein [Flavobacteriales bacterium]
MSTQVLYPTEVVAYRYGADQQVVIIAKGREDGYCKIQIQASMATIYPPIYMVTAEPCAAIGNFPYTVQKTVPYSTDLDYVNFQMADGTRQIPIHDIMEAADSPKALAKVADNQVTGMAYNSSDINVAIADAIKKLRAKYPNGVSAKMVDSGFVAVGSPVGIAYYYVVMEQQS